MVPLKVEDEAKKMWTDISTRVVEFSVTLLWSSSAGKEEICCAEGTSSQNPDWQGPPFPLLSLAVCVDGNLTVKALISCSWPILLYSQKNSAALPNSEESLRTATGERRQNKKENGQTFPCMCASSYVHIGTLKEFNKKLQRDKSMNVKHSGTNVLAGESGYVRKA